MIHGFQRRRSKKGIMFFFKIFPLLIGADLRRRIIMTVLSEHIIRRGHLEVMRITGHDVVQISPMGSWIGLDEQTAFLRVSRSVCNDSADSRISGSWQWMCPLTHLGYWKAIMRRCSSNYYQ